MVKYLSALCLGFIVCISVFSQDENSPIPYSVKYKLETNKVFVEMSSSEVEKTIKEDINNLNSGLKSNRFARAFPVDLHPYNSGVWQNTPDGGKVWRLGIRSASAYSIYLVLQDFYLMPNTRLFVYNVKMTEFWGPYTEKDNTGNKVYTIPPLSGNSIILEINILPGNKNFGTFKVAEVFHDFKNEFGISKLKNTLAGSCNVDINCSAGSDWQVEKLAVCKFIAGGLMCTGTLVNNVRNENIPYLLTANHCMKDWTYAAGAVYYFDLEKPYCGALDSKSSKIVNGSELLATTSKLDFALVKLNHFPSVTSKAYLAGWDARGIASTGGVGIHHPNGEEKKISVTADLLTTANFGEGYNNASHWLVAHWNTGVTEAGSSGSAFFSKDHRIIGTLSGGDAVCGNPVNDFYSKLSLAWNFYSNPSSQLSFWLDPDSSGINSIPGRDPYGFSDANCDTIWNIKAGESIITSNQDLSWGYISGYNNKGYSKFAEKFNISDTAEVFGIFLKASEVIPKEMYSYIEIKIWGGEDLPDKEIYTKPVYLKDLESNKTNFIEFDSLLFLTGKFFIGYSLEYNPATDTAFNTFAVSHAINRSGDTSTMYVYSSDTWTNISTVTTPSYFTSLGIGLFSCKNLNYKLNIPEKPTKTLSHIKSYPNPCTEYLTLEFPEKDKYLSFSCFDMTGKIFSVPYQFYDNKLLLDTRILKTGVYGVILIFKNTRVTKKFIVQNN